MVMAASSPDHTVVRLLEPPPDAKPGDRVRFVASADEDDSKVVPATPAQIAKKKIWEKLAPLVRLSDNVSIILYILFLLDAH